MLGWSQVARFVLLYDAELSFLIVCSQCFYPWIHGDSTPYRGTITMPSGSNKGQIIVAVLGFAGVVFTTVSSNWDKWFPRPAPPPIVTTTQLVSATPPDITTPPDTATPSPS